MIKYEFYDAIKEIDKILEKNVITDKIFQLIKEKTLEDYFFKKVRSVDWFFKLKRRGYFSPKKAPGPKKIKKDSFQIPSWNVLIYLEEVSQQTAKSNNEIYISELLKIIDKVTKFHIKNNKAIDNYRTWWFFVKIILNIPNNKIPNNIINLIPIWLDSKFDVTLPGADIATKLIPKFLNSDSPIDWDIATKLFEFISDVKWIHIPKERRSFLEARKKEPRTSLDPHWILKSLSKNSIKLGERGSVKFVFVLADRLKKTLRGEYPKRKFADFSNYWFSSLFSDPSVSINETKEILTISLRDIIVAKTRTDAKAGKYIMNKLLESEYMYPIFKRLVLFVIACEWRTYKKIFWNLIREDEGYALFNSHEFEPEVYKILEKNIEKFTYKEKETIKNIIEKVPKIIFSKKITEEIVATWKQKWFSALKSDKLFEQLYAEQKEITQKEEDVSFERVKIKTGEGPSPINKDDILKMSNKDIAKYLKVFKEKDYWEGPSIGGLAGVIKSSVQEKPGKFVDDLNPFLNLGYLYVYEILHGIRDAWKEKKTINWGKLLNFMKKYINQNGFWDDVHIVEGDSWPARHTWITGMIGEIIQEGTKDDEWALSEIYFSDAKEILFKILNREKVEQVQMTKDHITFALNSVHGKVITALIYLALLIARLERKKGSKKNVKWSLEFKRKYDYILKKRITESYILFGQYLPHLNYLDKWWVKSKINLFVNLKNKNLWEAFMSGYLFNRVVYKDLYKIMRNHYLKAIEFQFVNKDTKEQLIQHISLGYLQGDEDFSEGSLFGIILKRWDLFQIEEIIRYFWMQHANLFGDKERKDYITNTTIKSEITSKIIKFWRWVYSEKYKGKKNLIKQEKELLSELSKLIVFLNNIDSEKKKWLFKSAPYVYLNFNSPLFIEYLDKLKDRDKETTRCIGEIYLKMIKNFTPDYDKGNIRSIIDYLYKSGNKDNADKICNVYGKRGYEDLLRDIYEKYQSKNKSSKN